MASFDDGLGENWYEFEFKLYIFVKLVVWKWMADVHRLVVEAVLAAAAGGDESENVGENGLHAGDKEQYDSVGLAVECCSL